MDCKGTWALITGASSGIGRQISFQLASQGCNIVGVSNQPKKLKELQSDIEKTFSVKTHILNQDLALENAAISVFEYCQEHNLAIDILVNNAGILLLGDMTRYDFDHMKTGLQLHVTTPALLCRLFGEQMKNKGFGYILNISSISSVMPYPTISVYGATKSFLRKFTGAIRTELRPYGVGVTCLMPGATDTPLNDPMNFYIQRGKKFGLISSPESVARKGINALFKNRAVCVPGWINKGIIVVAPLIPAVFIRFIYGQQIRKNRVNGTSI